MFSFSNPFFFIAAIECPSLSLTDGSVAYAADTSPDFSIGTVATHTCSAGFALVGIDSGLVWTMIRQISLVHGVEVLPPANVSNLKLLN